MWSIVRKDLAIERRTGEMLSSLLLLALLVILLFDLGLINLHLVAFCIWCRLWFCCLCRSFALRCS